MDLPTAIDFIGTIGKFNHIDNFNPDFILSANINTNDIQPVINIHNNDYHILLTALQHTPIDQIQEIQAIANQIDALFMQTITAYNSYKNTPDNNQEAINEAADALIERCVNLRQLYYNNFRPAYDAIFQQTIEILPHLSSKSGG